jgi:type II secretory pathway pseudopilin PulG
MTLLEIVLTLCLLVILASLTWPALGRPMARQRLRESADQVRTEWVRARVEAMSSGRTCVFRCNANGDGYSIEAHSSEDDVGSDAALAGPSDASTADPADSRSQHRRLAEKIRFVAEQATAASPSAGQPAGFGNQSPAPGTGSSAAADGSSEAPIFFYADGTCSDAQLGLENEYGHTVTLSLRGLTGVVTVSEVLSSQGQAR